MVFDFICLLQIAHTQQLSGETDGNREVIKHFSTVYLQSGVIGIAQNSSAIYS